MTLQKLQERLRAAHALYEEAPEPRTDAVKRRAAMLSLAAMDKFLRAQPNWSAADSAQIFRIGRGFANVDRGHNPSWFSNTLAHHEPDSISKAGRKAEAAAYMQYWMDKRLSRQEAATKALRKIPREGARRSTLFANSNATWKTIAGWRANVMRGPSNSVERRIFDATLRALKSK